MAKNYEDMMRDEESEGFGPPSGGPPPGPPPGPDVDLPPDMDKMTDEVNSILSEGEEGADEGKGPEGGAEGDKAKALSTELEVDLETAKGIVEAAEKRPELEELDGKALAARLKEDYSLRMSLEEEAAEGASFKGPSETAAM